MNKTEKKNKNQKPPKTHKNPQKTDKKNTRKNPKAYFIKRIEFLNLAKTTRDFHLSGG